MKISKFLFVIFILSVISVTAVDAGDLDTNAKVDKKTETTDGEKKNDGAKPVSNTGSTTATRKLEKTVKTDPAAEPTAAEKAADAAAKKTAAAETAAKKTTAEKTEADKKAEADKKKLECEQLAAQAAI